MAGAATQLVAGIGAVNSQFGLSKSVEQPDRKERDAARLRTERLKTRDYRFLDMNRRSSRFGRAAKRRYIDSFDGGSLTPGVVRRHPTLSGVIPSDRRFEDANAIRRATDRRQSNAEFAVLFKEPTAAEQHS